MRTLVVSILIGILLIFSSFAYASDNYDAKRYAALIFAQDYAQEIRAKRYKVEENRPKEKQTIERIEEKGPGCLELGPEIYYFRYKEPSIMEEKGMMYGLTGAYSWHKNFMLKAEGRLAGGKVDYDSQNSGSIDSITDFSAEIRGLGGYDFIPAENFILTPYFGIGYRYLDDDASGKISSTNAGGYERESNYIYSPAGIEGVFKMQDGWSIGGAVEYDIFWHGKQKSYLSDVTCYNNTWGYYTFGDVENTQDKGYGIRGSIKLKKKGEYLDFMIEPFIRYWNIKDSKETISTTTSSKNYILTLTSTEPKNNSTEIGVKAAVGF